MPGELSVAGFDDIALARLVFPNLTTIRQPLSTMAERAASMLIRGDKSGVEIVPATLEIRESTGPLSA